MLFKEMKVICEIMIILGTILCFYFVLEQPQPTLVRVHLIFFKHVAAYSHLIITNNIFGA